MPAVQSTYSATMSAARAGMRANEEPVRLISRDVETAGGIGFGIVVAQGVRDGGCIVMGASHTASDFLGVTMLQRNTDPANVDKFPQNESALIMNEGVIWVATGAAVAAGDAVVVTLATGLLSAAAPGAGVLALPGARWDSSTTGAGQLAKLRLT